MQLLLNQIAIIFQAVEAVGGIRNTVKAVGVGKVRIDEVVDMVGRIAISVRKSVAFQPLYVPIHVVPDLLVVGVGNLLFWATKVGLLVDGLLEPVQAVVHIAVLPFGIIAVAYPERLGDVAVIQRTYSILNTVLNGIVVEL